MGEPAKSEGAEILDPLHGSLSVRYRYRATAGASDSDLYEYLTLSYGDPTKDVASAVLSARFAEDLDGNQSVQGFYPFTSLDDSYRSPATQELYNAYLDLRPVDMGLTVRLGRQTLDDIPEAVLMDGGWVRYQSGSRVAISAFGGIPVNLYESSTAGDSMFGAAVDYVPDPLLPGRYRIDYLHLHDDNIFGLHNDNLTGFTIDEGWGPFRSHFRYTLLEGKSRDLVGRVTATVPEEGFLVDFQGSYVFHQIESLSYAIDPYSSFMMNLEPYVDLQARASKSFGEVFVVDATFTSRKLVRESVDTTYNHEFKRVEVAPKFLGWPIPQVSVTFSADFWNSSGDNFWTAGGDLAWNLTRGLVLSLGSSYALYSIDEFTGEEHDRVRTYTVALRWRVEKNSSIDVRYTIEENAIDRFRIAELGFRHVF